MRMSVSFFSMASALGLLVWLVLLAAITLESREKHAIH